jgi:hypothetical protein
LDCADPPDYSAAIPLDSSGSFAFRKPDVFEQLGARDGG